MKDLTPLSFNSGWFEYFKSDSGRTNILSLLSHLGYEYPSLNDRIMRDPYSVKLSYYLINLDPRLAQFIPARDSRDTVDVYQKCCQGSVVALLDITGLLRKEELSKDVLFTAISCMAHGISKITSHYLTGTDQCDLTDTEVYTLKDSYANYDNVLLNEEAGKAIFDLYNLDVDIFYEYINNDSGAGDGRLYESTFSINLISDGEVRTTNEYATEPLEDPLSEEEEAY